MDGRQCLHQQSNRRQEEAAFGNLHPPERYVATNAHCPTHIHFKLYYDKSSSAIANTYCMCSFFVYTQTYKKIKYLKQLVQMLQSTCSSNFIHFWKRNGKGKISFEKQKNRIMRVCTLRVCVHMCILTRCLLGLLWEDQTVGRTFVLDLLERNKTKVCAMYKSRKVVCIQMFGKFLKYKSHIHWHSKVLDQ